MSATRIIAIRHGETDWNVQTRIQGQIDIALNDKGRWQAQRVGLALAQESIDCIYSSDLLRAQATAQAIAQQHVQYAKQGHTVHLHTGLRERGFGLFEGHTYADIQTQWPEQARRWRERDPDFAPQGGESPVQVMQRVAHTLQELAAAHMGAQIVLVAHGGIMDMLYRLATQQSVDAYRSWALGNAAINRLLWTPESLTLVGWGDVRHLEEDATLDEFGA